MEATVLNMFLSFRSKRINTSGSFRWDENDQEHHLISLLDGQIIEDKVINFDV